jgi:hypothetical protein
VNNADVGTSTHTHGIPHIHQATYTNFTLGLYAMGTAATAMSTLSFTNATSGSAVIADKLSSFASGSNAAATFLSPQTGYTGGARDAAGSAAVSATPTGTATISLNNAGSSSAFSILPPYFRVTFVMRVA